MPGAYDQQRPVHGSGYCVALTFLASENLYAQNGGAEVMIVKQGSTAAHRQKKLLLRRAPWGPPCSLDGNDSLRSRRLCPLCVLYTGF